MNFRIVERQTRFGKRWMIQKQLLGLFWCDYMGDSDVCLSFEEAKSKASEWSAAASTPERVVWP